MQFTKIAQNLMHNLHHCRNLIQIRYQKGFGTKMHKCLVGFQDFISNLSSKFIYEPILITIFMNYNMKTQIFHLIKYDLLGQCH